MINFNSLPAPLPQDIESYMISGEWDTAREMIEERLKLDLPRMLRDRLLAAEEPTTCPHGRPVVLRLHIRDVEKGFKRA